ncbi:hypothetical protein BJY59DRAFT_693645 [Rhodotorula toruloides]
MSLRFSSFFCLTCFVSSWTCLDRRWMTKSFLSDEMDETSEGAGEGGGRVFASWTSFFSRSTSSFSSSRSFSTFSFAAYPSLISTLNSAISLLTCPNSFLRLFASPSALSALLFAADVAEVAFST